jgi:Mg/Co/Ni transporter MgtE
MKLYFWIGLRLMKKINPQKLIEMATEIWPMILERIPREQRVEFLKTLLAQNISYSLNDLSRKERAALMNELLPLIAKEFPLTDLDILAAFSDQEVRD